ncbi:hypothetical protein BJY04DRAFT_154447 [Aspergillus karnatakaensis]|uniref:uncharacterized protein n=1 Tax=Aspergillus karnatakaensis TaxID=1810916 RepID=UPI003CCD8853
MPTKLSQRGILPYLLRRLAIATIILRLHSPYIIIGFSLRFSCPPPNNQQADRHREEWQPQPHPQANS